MKKKKTPARNALAFGVVVSVLVASVGVSQAEDSPLVAAGEQVYNDNCATCHGDDLRDTGSAFDLKQLGADERPRFDRSVMSGKGQMPSWKGILNPDQMDQLWAYIQAHAN